MHGGSITSSLADATQTIVLSTAENAVPFNSVLVRYGPTKDLFESCVNAFKTHACAHTHMHVLYIPPQFVACHKTSNVLMVNEVGKQLKLKWKMETNLSS